MMTRPLTLTLIASLLAGAAGAEIPRRDLERRILQAAREQESPRVREAVERIHDAGRLGELMLWESAADAPEAWLREDVERLQSAGFLPLRIEWLPTDEDPGSEAGSTASMSSPAATPAASSTRASSFAGGSFLGLPSEDDVTPGGEGSTGPPPPDPGLATPGGAASGGVASAGTGIGEEAATRAALAYLEKKFPSWPSAFIQGVKRKGDHYVVTLIPENKMGVLLFFTTYKAYVNATTGVVEKFH